MMTNLILPLIDSAGRGRGTLIFSKLPAGPQPMATGLREGSVYRFSLNGTGQLAQIEPRELFNFDDDSKRSGRFAPLQHVGTVAIVVSYADHETSTVRLEIFPTKLTKDDEYRRMLRDIAAHAADAVLQGFAPSIIGAQPFKDDASLLYRRFAILEAHVCSLEFSTSIEQVLRNPHVEWRAVSEWKNSGDAHPSGPGFGRAFSAPGPRKSWIPSSGRLALATLPSRLERSQQVATLDTVPNRFVKDVLESWRSTADELRAALAGKRGSVLTGPVRRGLLAAEQMIETLDEILSQPIFRQVGSLGGRSIDSHLSIRRDGYRQIHHMSLLVDAGLEIPWEAGMDDIYHPSLRNVSKLYEVWCYLTLVDTISRVCGVRKTVNSFLPSENGLSLQLASGDGSMITWRIKRRERELELRLFFNLRFLAGKASWSAEMKPDYSLEIRPLNRSRDEARGSLDVWVHFDAKYRVRDGSPINMAPDRDEGEGKPSSRGSSKRDDLLKMHAYRDAIRRTAGAYVLYPGDSELQRRQFAELLPGLGAFPLRPGAGEAHGTSELAEFLTEVFDHVADHASQHERERFWRNRIYANPPRPVRLSSATDLDQPPADTEVLVGYVRGSKHRHWIEQARCYNIRADDRRGAVRLTSRVLSASLILLYERVDGRHKPILLARCAAWRAADRSELARSGYPNPGSRVYFLADLENDLVVPEWLSEIDVDRLRPGGALSCEPFAVTWLELMESVAR